jgi:hypothetical protein
MNRLLVVTAMLLLPAAMVAQVAHLKFSQNGEFVSLSEPTGPSSNFSLNVSRNTTNSGTTVNIDYGSIAFAPDFSSLTIVEIIGSIPATDLTGTSIQNLGVNFSTADLAAGSVNLSCTIVFSPFSETCSAAPAGTISLTFTETDTSSTRVLVLGEETTVGNLTTRIHQRSDNSSAKAQGTVFGVTVVGGSAQVGINHSSTLEATRTQ